MVGTTKPERGVDETGIGASCSRNPSFKLKIDLGREIGVKKSCAQLLQNYKSDELIGKQVLCVVNFPPRHIGPAISEVLILGLPDNNNECILITADKEVPIGGKLY